MIHLSPLPGTPYYRPGSFEEIRDAAVRSAQALHRGGATGCLVQTVDRVYSVEDRSDPARTVAAGLIVRAIVEGTAPEFAVGVQLMQNGIRESLAVAKVAGGSFVRAVALVGSTPADHGTLPADPYAVMSYRRSIDATDVAVIADVASSHHRSSLPIGELARRAQRVGADAVALGDRDEGRTAGWLDDVRAAAPGLRIVLSGHTDHENAARLLGRADGAFVGTCLEPDGWGGSIDEGRVREYMEIVRGLPPLVPCSH